MKMTEKEYIESEGGYCPKCGSTDIVASHMECDGSSAYQPVSCDNCDFEWKDIYTLTGVDMELRKEHFLLEIEECNCGADTTVPVLFSCTEDKDSDHIADCIAKTWRGEGEQFSEEEVYDFGDGITAQVGDIRRISKEDYTVMEKYLSDLSDVPVQYKDFLEKKDD